jgi:hypothetical protein
MSVAIDSHPGKTPDPISQAPGAAGAASAFEQKLEGVC